VLTHVGAPPERDSLDTFMNKTKKTRPSDKYVKPVASSHEYGWEPLPKVSVAGIVVVGGWHEDSVPVGACESAVWEGSKRETFVRRDHLWAVVHGDGAFRHLAATSRAVRVYRCPCTTHRINSRTPGPADWAFPPRCRSWHIETEGVAVPHEGRDVARGRLAV
jgi:hypothetical protein